MTKGAAYAVTTLKRGWPNGRGPINVGLPVEGHSTASRTAEPLVTLPTERHWAPPSAGTKFKMSNTGGGNR